MQAVAKAVDNYRSSAGADYLLPSYCNVAIVVRLSVHALPLWWRDNRRDKMTKRPTYEQLLAQLEAIANRCTRANSADSTGAKMVQMRAALLDQTREVIAAAKAPQMPTAADFAAAVGPCGK
jgi:hypothetical protein